MNQEAVKEPTVAPAGEVFGQTGTGGLRRRPVRSRFSPPVPMNPARSAGSSTWKTSSMPRALEQEKRAAKGFLSIPTMSRSLLDAWLVSQVIIQNTRTLCPLVAVQPVYMHPYTVAKMVTSFAHLYGRRVYLNMIAGGFKNDLTALHDTTPHDRRYDRLVEYTTVIKNLLAARIPADLSKGNYYATDNLKLFPPLPAGFIPRDFCVGLFGGRTGGSPCDRAMHRDQIPAPAGRRGKRRFRRTTAISEFASASSPAKRTTRHGGSRTGDFPEDRKGQDHPSAGDEGVGLALAQSSCPSWEKNQSVHRTGWFLFKITRRCAPIL